MSATGFTFTGTTGNDSFNGGVGNDTIFGNGGSDTLLGGQGSDSIGAGSTTPGTGTDTVSGGSDMTMLFGGQGDDFLFGGTAGNDLIFGNQGNDTITLFNASASVFGGMGDDTINAAGATGAGRTTPQLYISGDAGNDSIVGGQVNETILGGDGNDSINGGTFAAPTSMTTGTTTTFSGGGIGTIEQLFGNAGNDTISSASFGAVSLFGGQDNDVLTLSGGNSSISNTHYAFGNLGNDLITISGGAASAFGGQGNDTITAAGSTGTGTTGVHNYLSGDLGQDSIVAGSGGDTLIGGAGTDTLTLGAGNDTIIIHTGDSTAANGGIASTANLDYVNGFSNGATQMNGGTSTTTTNDVIKLSAHNDLHATTGSDHVQNYAFASAGTGGTSGVAGDFQSAYAYAYGGTDSSGNQLSSHFGGNEYLSVSNVTLNGQNGSILFVNDAQHTAVFLTGVNTALTDNSVIGIA